MNAYNQFPASQVQSGRRVLILDDDPMMTRTLELSLQGSDIQTQSANHHQVFFRQIAHWRPDIIVLDLMMPGMDGVQVIAEMAEKGHRADLIIISGIDRQTLESAQRTAQMRGFRVLGSLVKPFRIRELKALVEDHRHETVPTAASGVRQPANSQAGLPSASDLEAAIGSGALGIALQPKIYCRTGTLAGFEALARWQHEGRAVPPDQFIRLAEGEALIDQLTWVVFEQAITALCQLRKTLDHLVNVDELSIAINISVLSLARETLFERMVQLCLDSGIRPDRIIFELTESSAMRDPVRSIETLTRLRLKGFKLSIDDFGTGYSSMAQLVRLPFSEIKVDKSFVMNALSATEDEAVVRSIVNLGSNLGLQSTAEGIESEEVLQYLRSIGCDMAQGFGIGRPMAYGDILPWLSAREEERENARLATLRQSRLMASAGEQRFERLTALAKRLFRTQVSLITLLDDRIQLIKAGSQHAGSSMPRNASICHHTLRGDGVMVVEDARLHPALNNNLLLQKAGFVFYAGHPICFEAGEKAGAICVIDEKPRNFSANDRARLAAFARVAEEELRRGDDARSDISGLVAGQTFMTQAKALLWLSHELGVRSFIVLISLEEMGKLELRFGDAAAESIVSGLAQAFDEAFGRDDLVGHPRKDEMAAIVMATDRQKVCKRLEQFVKAVQRIGNLQEVLSSVGLSTAIQEAKPAAGLSVSVLFESTRLELAPVFWPATDYVT